MNCPKCGEAHSPEQTSCNQCGLVFYKYEAYQKNRELLAQHLPTSRSSLHDWILQAVRTLKVPTESMKNYWGAYVLLWALFALWGFSYIFMSIPELGRDSGFMHMVNLPFHEAGHVIFGLLGQFIGSLGGTLGQLIIPVICGVALLKSRADTFGASICLWWFGQNFLDIAPYMADARAGELLLLGGNYGKSSPYGFHDWEFILGELGLLPYDSLFAAITLNLGRLIMLLAIYWGGFLLWRAKQEQKPGS